MTPKTKTFLERLFSTIVLLSLLGGAVAWNNPVAYAVLICLFCNLTTVEWFRMLGERREETNRPLMLLGGLAYPWLLALAAFSEQHITTTWEKVLAFSLGFLILYTLIAFFCELFRMDYRGRSGAQALASMGITLLAFIYPVWLFAFSLVYVAEAGSIAPLLWLILVTKLSDIWAYCSGVLLGGKIFGQRKFSPVVSPKKTWEGIIGSFILTVASGYGLSLLLLPQTSADYPNDSLMGAGLSALIFLLAVPGDLAGSLIKRGLAVKDSGSLLPGIGGIFDLIDSPAFTVSATIVFGALITSFA